MGSNPSPGVLVKEIEVIDLKSKYVQLPSWNSLSYSEWRIYDAIGEGVNHILVRFPNDYGLSIINDDTTEEGLWDVALIKYFGRLKFEFVVQFDDSILPWPVKNKTIQEAIDYGYSVEKMHDLTDFGLLRGYFEGL